MTTAQLYEMIHSQPFRPFIIRMADGREYPVPHPDFIAYPRGARIAFVMRDQESGTLLDLLPMTALDHAPTNAVTQ